jgi:hypothetical protein
VFNVKCGCKLEILKEGSLFGKLNDLFMKIAFLNATSSPKKNRPCGAIFSRRVINLARRSNRKINKKPAGTVDE